MSNHHTHEGRLLQLSMRGDDPCVPHAEEQLGGKKDQRDNVRSRGNFQQTGLILGEVYAQEFSKGGVWLG
jgi:hypothetical protein